VLWGAPASGKTTFLAALNVAVTLNHEWTLRSQDEASRRLLSDMTESFVGRNFPRATQGFESLRLALTGEVQASVVGILRRPVRLRVGLDLEVADSPGEFFGPRSADRPGTRQLFDFMMRSTGIILFFDPVREARLGDSYSYFHSMAERLHHEYDLRDGQRLPHHVAVCIAKVDDPDVFSTAKKSGHLVVDGADPYQFQRVADGHAEAFFGELCAMSQSGRLFQQDILRYFSQDRTRYFGVSSPGFFLNSSLRFNPDDYINTLPGAGLGEAMLRGAPTPIDVLKPLAWLVAREGERPSPRVEIRDSSPPRQAPQERGRTVPPRGNGILKGSGKSLREYPGEYLDRFCKSQIENLAAARIAASDRDTTRKRVLLRLNNLEKEYRKRERMKNEATVAGREDLADAADNQMTDIEEQYQVVRERYDEVAEEYDEASRQYETLTHQVESLRANMETFKYKYLLAKRMTATSAPADPAGTLNHGSGDEQAIKIGQWLASARPACEDAARSHQQRGHALLNEGDFKRANAEFQKSQESSSGLTAAAKFDDGILAVTTGRTGDAIWSFTLALQSGTPYVAARAALNLGCLNHAASRLKKAVSMYQAALSYGDAAIEPRDAFLLARIEEKRGNLSAAWFNYATAADHEDSPFASTAEMRCRNLMPFAQQYEIFDRILRISGYRIPAKTYRN
jgi:tetratricopeptide (TPR) repeat protein